MPWLMQQFFSNFRHYTVWYGCLISALLLHLTNTKLHIFIDLASMHIPGVLFYPDLHHWNLLRPFAL
ncbi:MAG: hypothetical protein ACLR8P_13415 [Clostridium fessum]